MGIFTDAIIAEIQSQAEESREREAWEWEDLLSEQVRGLTGNQLIKGKMNDRGEVYKVLPMADYRERLMKIAGLAVAAVEAFDRAEPEASKTEKDAAQ